MKFKRFIKRIKLFFYKLTIDKHERVIKRNVRRSDLTLQKKQMLNDLLQGWSLKEFRMTEDDEYLFKMELTTKSTWKGTEYLYKKYRGFRKSEHPSIYKKV